jgi:hypothetical protein
MARFLDESFPGKTGAGDVLFDETGWDYTSYVAATNSLNANCRLRLGPDAFGFGEECLQLVMRADSGMCAIDMTSTYFGTRQRAFMVFDFAVGWTDLLDKASGSYHSIFRNRSASANNCMMISLKNVSGVLKLHLQYRTNNTNTEASEEPTIVVGTPYRLECYYTGSTYSGTKQCIWKLDGVTIGTYALTGTIRTDVGEVRVGGINVAGFPGSETTLYIYRVVADDSGWVGARPVNNYAYQNIAWMDQVVTVEMTGSLPAYAFGLGHGAWAQPGYAAGLAAAVAAQEGYACGVWGVTGSRNSYAAGFSSLAAGQPAYAAGQSSATSLTAGRSAYLAGSHYLQAGRPGYALGFASAGASQAAFTPGALGGLGQQPAYLGGSGDYLAASVQAHTLGLAPLSGQLAACVVCGLPLGRVGFRLGLEQLAFSCPRTYPLREPRERLQVVARSAGGTLRVQDKGVGTRKVRLAFRGLSGADYAALLRWYDEISVGALNAFTFIDEGGVERQVRWLGALEFEQSASGRYSGELTLEEVF